MKITTDKKKIDELLTRGVEKIYPDKKSLQKKLEKGERIKLYCGFDPSAPSLHIGNAIQINKLAQFQELGHEVIFLVGDFTGMIGDPTDKTATRKKLTREDVLANAKNYKKQATAYLDFGGDNPAKVEYNSRWSDSLTFKDLIEVSSNFTVQQMIQRDMFQERIKNEKPIHLHEFLYPLAQGYDSVAMDVDLEIGGNDQMFNMMCGRDLMRAMGKKEKFVMTLKLLADDKGAKMGKTEGNAVFLDQDPVNMYGIIMSWPDGVIGVGFELCTKVSMPEVVKIVGELKKGKINPRDYKMRLAFEITKLVHGEKEALKAQNDFIKKFQKKDTEHILVNAPVVKMRAKASIVDVLAENNMTKSKGEARRLIKQGGIKVDGKPVKDIDYEIYPSKKEQLVQRGKLKFLKIVKE